MKKLSLIAATAVGLLSASFAFAENVDLNGYYSTKHPQTTLATKANVTPPTDITVINGSTANIYAIVPNSPIFDLIYSGGDNDHIRHSTYAGNTHLVLQDTYNRIFFDGYVCRLAVVSVDSLTGVLRTRVDSEYCL